ncbi:MAG: 2-amino-4-hydroxy-6-hydroxymethyldihydropteridine diphosphokinase [Bacteroidetes bacterium]|nr:2-amino-4-hydroxy-6-hydroxymethyldihydropteridine diphosphokinase [Bacteroidota bacterium]
MNKIYLLIGGNEGNRFSYLKQAITNIEIFCGELLKTSSIYETAPWGKTDQDLFLNQALLIQSALDPVSTMNTVLEIEKKMGRKRIEKYGSRIIDIDILFFNNEIVNIPQLKIPHPEIQNRRFVLTPMNEIAPTFMHPVLRKTVHELLEECPDQLAVKKIIE